MLSESSSDKIQELVMFNSCIEMKSPITSNLNPKPQTPTSSSDSTVMIDQQSAQLVRSL